ncbi:hypothetical protein DFH06DRAFT_769104 [Mycena polygramma]|nr:hypothetical protein DFH06DRAFT_769104 [Mycena polygramma]
MMAAEITTWSSFWSVPPPASPPSFPLQLEVYLGSGRCAGMALVSPKYTRPSKRSDLKRFGWKHFALGAGLLIALVWLFVPMEKCSLGWNGIFGSEKGNRGAPSEEEPSNSDGHARCDRNAPMCREATTTASSCAALEKIGRGINYGPDFPMEPACYSKMAALRGPLITEKLHTTAFFGAFSTVGPATLGGCLALLASRRMLGFCEEHELRSVLDYCRAERLVHSTISDCTMRAPEWRDVFPVLDVPVLHVSTSETPLTIFCRERRPPRHLLRDRPRSYYDDALYQCLQSPDSLVQYVLVLDAGSTGSRIHIHKFNNCSPSPAYGYEVFKMS